MFQVANTLCMLDVFNFFLKKTNNKGWQQNQRVGDIVWLRLVGFSWWPAKIISEETWPGLAAEQGNNDTLARFYNEHIDSALFVSYIITNWLRLLINFFAKFLVGLKKNRN